MHRCVRLTKQVSIFDWLGTPHVICLTTAIASVYMHPRRNVLIGFMYVYVSHFAHLTSDWKLTEDYERLRLLGMHRTTPEISGQDQGKEPQHQEQQK